jgi:RNA-directed DNA polymerase
MYHRHVVAKACFNAIDQKIWQMLWRWSHRRHPTKGAKWVLRRYFHRDGGLAHAFAAKERRVGKTALWRLFRAMTIPIVRHVKIQAQANPYDTRWTPYFVRRHAMKDSVRLFGASIWC